MDKNLHTEMPNDAADTKVDEANETTERLTVEVPTGVQAGGGVGCTCPPSCCG